MGRENDGFESGLSKYSLQADVEPCWPWGVQTHWVCRIRSPPPGKWGSGCCSVVTWWLTSAEPAAGQPKACLCYVGGWTDWKDLLHRLAFNSAPSFALLLDSQLDCESRLQAVMIPEQVKPYLRISSSRKNQWGNIFLSSSALRTSSDLSSLPSTRQGPGSTSFWH